MKNKKTILKKINKLLNVMPEQKGYLITGNSKYCPFTNIGKGKVYKKCIDCWADKVKGDECDTEEIKSILDSCNKVWLEIKQKNG